MARGDSSGPAGTAGAGDARPGGRAADRGSGETRATGEAAGSPTGAARATGAGAGTGTGRAGQATAPSATSKLAWIALAVAGVLTAWQVVYSLTSPTTPNPETYSSVSLLLTLVLSVGAIVLGIVALGQRALPRWPATAATAVGSFAFIVCVATWIGTLMV